MTQNKIRTEPKLIAAKIAQQMGMFDMNDKRTLKDKGVMTKEGVTVW
jgi:hypothetical protein